MSLSSLATVLGLLMPPTAMECRGDQWVGQLATVCDRLYQNNGDETLTPPQLGYGRVSAEGRSKASVLCPRYIEWTTLERTLGPPRRQGAWLVFDKQPVGQVGAACVVSVLREVENRPPAYVALIAQPGDGRRPRSRPGCEHWDILTELEADCKSVQPVRMPQTVSDLAVDDFRGQVEPAQYRRSFLPADSALPPEGLEPLFGPRQDLGGGRSRFTQSPATFVYGERCDIVAEVEAGRVRSVELVASAVPGQTVFQSAKDKGLVERLRAAVRARPTSEAALAATGLRGFCSERGGTVRIRLSDHRLRMSSLVAAFGAPEVRPEAPGDRRPELAEYLLPYAHFDFDGCHMTTSVGRDALGRMTDRVLDLEVECPLSRPKTDE